MDQSTLEFSDQAQSVVGPGFEKPTWYEIVGGALGKVLFGWMSQGPDPIADVAAEPAAQPSGGESDMGWWMHLPEANKISPAPAGPLTFDEWCMATTSAVPIAKIDCMSD